MESIGDKMGEEMDWLEALVQEQESVEQNEIEEPSNMNSFKEKPRLIPSWVRQVRSVDLSEEASGGCSVSLWQCVSRGLDPAVRYLDYQDWGAR